MVPWTEATGVFLACRRAIFRSGFRLDRRKSWQSESYTSCLNMSSFLRTQACGSTRCESERLCARARHPRGGNYEIFNIILFYPSVFAHMVDVVPDVKFWRSWCRRKACVTFFLKVRALHRGELEFARFARYDLANRGRWSVPRAGGAFSDWDSFLTGGALDDSRVARHSWSNPLA